MKFLLTVVLGMIIGSGATFYYIYQSHADASEQALMRDTITTYLPFMAEYINP